MAASVDHGSPSIITLTTMFPTLEFEFIESVLSHNGGSMESTVHYLMAVVEEPEAIPVSDDIGGLPQLLIDDGDDEQGSVAGSPTVSVDVESNGEDDTVDIEPLPSYKDVTLTPPPPSYDSLISASPLYGSRPITISFTDRLRRRCRKKCGYSPQNS